MGKSNNTRVDRRTFLKYSGAASIGTIFAGCTGNQSRNETTTGSTESTGGGSGTGDNTDTEFNYVTTQTPSSIDPMKGSDNLETIFLHNVYDPLLYYTDTTPPELKNWLAEDYSISEDGQTYTFQLQPDAVFHNDDPVTASDVKYSVQRMMDMQQGFSWMWEGILSPENVEVVNETTVEMTTNEVFAPFLYTLPFLFIVNEEQVKANATSDGQYGDHGDYGSAWLEENDAGSGPYKFSSRERKRDISLEKNNDWWSEFPHGQSGYEAVTIDMVQETATAAGRMREGAEMADQWLPLQTYKDLASEDGVRVHAKATFNPFYIYMHTQREPLSDIHVRRAISYAFDYEAALNDIMSGDSDHLNGPLPSAMWSHTDNLETYSQNLDQAQAELDKSDYTASDIDLNYTYVSGLTVEQNMGLLLQSNLQELGGTVSVNKAPWSNITEMATSKESTPDMLAVYLSFSYADPDTFLYPAWHSSSHGSWTSASWYQNDQVDQLLEDARRTITQEDRIPIYEEAQQVIAEEAPALFIMNQAKRNAISTDMRGFKDNGITGYRQTYHRYYQG
ncbi:peptide ABC transporter substrate-binding protein [Halorubrum persicum]|uniref:Peptide ABC transporter substrate-binding protein n=2 Tax=Halorubrum persicum TaxID=1383844 RepID=A0A2G1WFZ3_9EURY|nr:peptide ABC transporter substrate-binding protein [Halorubrum persicum]